MDTAQLEWMLFRHSTTKLKFGGVLAIDELPLRPKNMSYIINLDPSTSPGSHWVAVYFEKGNAEYFDSYGLPPPELILNFIKANSYQFTCNSQQLQHVRTAVCGQYCAYYVLKKCANQKMSKILLPFSNVNFISNDKLVFKFIKKLIRVLLPLINPMLEL